MFRARGGRRSRQGYLSGAGARARRPRAADHDIADAAGAQGQREAIAAWEEGRGEGARPGGEGGRCGETRSTTTRSLSEHGWDCPSGSGGGASLEGLT